MEHSARKNARGEQTTRRKMFEPKFYHVKVSNTIKIAGEEEACAGCQELGV